MSARISTVGPGPLRSTATTPVPPTDLLKAQLGIGVEIAIDRQQAGHVALDRFADRWGLRQRR
jgi:hypothetical protein